MSTNLSEMAFGTGIEKPKEYPQLLADVMAIHDVSERAIAAKKHLRIMCANIRLVEGEQDLFTLRPVLSRKAKEALDQSTKIFLSNNVLTQEQIDEYLRNPNAI